MIPCDGTRVEAGWPRVIARPGLPQIRPCVTDAPGSLYHGIRDMTQQGRNARTAGNRYRACEPVMPCILIVTTTLLASMPAAGLAQTTTIDSKAAADAKEQADTRLAWWRDARFGMFVHWGPVSLKGTEIGWSRRGPRRGSPRGGTGHVPMEEYDNLYKTFNPVEFDADEWCRIARNAGMKYVVFTTKHHDGFSMFDSKHTEYDIMASPYGQDICKQLADACHRHGLGLGWYYSPRDWYHPDFATERHAKYLEFYLGQLRELCSNYGKVDILWFDGLDSRRELWQNAPAESFALVRRLQPGILLNNRGGLPGDFDTPEQRVGAFDRDRPWETCMTLCRQWAWKPDDQMKSLKECLNALVRTAGGDGNFLFNVGPMPDGRIEPRQVERLKEMGDWLDKYGETIYGTRGGPFKPGPFGASTYKGRTVYLHILDWSGDDVELPPISARVVECRLLTGGQCAFAQTTEGVRLSIPEEHRQTIDTLVALRLDRDAKDVPPVNWRMPSGSVGYGKAVKASNVFRKMAAYSAAQACDDDPTTRWATDAGTSVAWLEVDLSKPTTIDRVRISEAAEFGERIRRFQLEYKDGDEWRVALSGGAVGRDYEHRFTPITARHVRLTILEATEGPTIWEFQLFSDE
jgi:alpha-L-fucosidase